MVSVFGDESADESMQRVFAVAGVIAEEKEWERLEDIWSQRTGGIPFHATDCDSNQGIYKDKPNRENKELYKDLVQILVNSKAYGFGACLDLAGFREFYPDIPQDMCYYKAFWETVRTLAHFAKGTLHAGVKFTFDNRTESNYNAGMIYHTMANDSAVNDGPEMFDEISFASHIKQPRIQAGDLYAREVMKHLDNMIGPVQRTRKSWEALGEAKRFGADFFMREYFQEMRQKTYLLEQEDPDFNRHTYMAWLKKTNQTDTMSNRFKFLAIVTEKDKKK